MESGLSPCLGGLLKTLFLALEGLTGTALQRALSRGDLPLLQTLGVSGTQAAIPVCHPFNRAAMLVCIMTGSWPDQHGILTGAVGDPDSGMLRPVNETDRLQPAIWEVLDEQGVPCLSVGWPLSAGGNTVHASVVTSGFGETPGTEAHPEPAAFLHPASLAGQLGWLWLRPEELDPCSLSVLAPGWEEVDRSTDSRPGILATTVAGNVSRHAAFLELLATSEWKFATLCMSLPAELSSLERAGVPMADGLLDGLCDRAMPLINALIGAILDQIPEETNLIVAGTPHPELPGEAGFVVAAGPAVDPGTFPKVMNLTELAPLAWGSCGFFNEGYILRGVAASDPPPRKLAPSRSHSTASDYESLLGTEAECRHAPDRPLSPLETWRIEALGVLASSFMLRGNWSDAIPALESQVRMLPLHLVAHLHLSECWQRLGCLEEALDATYSAIHPAFGSDPVALLRAAELEALLGRRDRARALLRQAVPAMKAFPLRRLLMANVLIFLRAWPEAEELLAELASEEPENAYVLYRLGRCHVARKEWQGAFERAMESLRLDPSNALVHELLGHALHGMGMLEQARVAFENATEIDPRWARPKAMLVSLACRMKRPQEEIESLRVSYLQKKRSASKPDRTFPESGGLGSGKEEKMTGIRPVPLDPRPTAGDGARGGT